MLGGMQFGVTILPDPPCSRFVELVQAAEASGFHWAYTYDSHILWQDGSAFLAAAAPATERIGLGFCVTNPGTREPTVTASFHATLNSMAPGRVAVMIGRGDSARRTIGLEPVKVREFEAATELIRELANGRTADWNDKQITLEWAKDLPEIPVWVAGHWPHLGPFRRAARWDGLFVDGPGVGFFCFQVAILIGIVLLQGLLGLGLKIDGRDGVVRVERQTHPADIQRLRLHDIHHPMRQQFVELPQLAEALAGGHRDIDRARNLDRSGDVGGHDRRLEPHRPELSQLLANPDGG